MNVKKYALSDCGHVTQHYERRVRPGHYSNQDIDDTKTKLNYNLGPKRDITQVSFIKKALNELPHAKRKDLVCMASVVLNAPDDLNKSMHERFFEESYRFLKNRFCSAFNNPDDGVISCFCHLDESTPHIHFAFLPVIKTDDGTIKFLAKEAISRDNLKTLHQDLQTYLESQGIRAKILNGKTQRDAFGRALSVSEMKKRDYQRKLQHKHTFKGGRF